MKQNIDFPEFKDCECGARIRIAYVENPHFANVYIGVTNCACGNSHYSLVGDDADVRAAAADLERFMSSNGQEVIDRAVHSLSRH